MISMKVLSPIFVIFFFDFLIVTNFLRKFKFRIVLQRETKHFNYLEINMEY